jgi:hypothetical protein
MQVLELGHAGRCPMPTSSSNECQLYSHKPSDTGDATELLSTLQQGAADVPDGEVRWAGIQKGSQYFLCVAQWPT